jgi:hypothetical protein
MTAAGIVSAALVLVSTIGMFPAALERVTVHATLVPRLILVVGQLSDINAGVDQRVSVADWVEVPRVPVIAAVASVLTLPTTALNVPLVLPAGTWTLAGVVTRAEFELMVTVVAVAAVCESLTEHELVELDISPVGEHITALISTVVDGTNWIELEADEPL